MVALSLALVLTMGMTLTVSAASVSDSGEDGSIKYTTHLTTFENTVAIPNTGYARGSMDAYDEEPSAPSIFTRVYIDMYNMYGSSTTFSKYGYGGCTLTTSSISYPARAVGRYWIEGHEVDTNTLLY